VEFFNNTAWAFYVNLTRNSIRQGHRVPGKSRHHLSELGTDLGHAIMHPAVKLNLGGFEFCDHSLIRSDPSYGDFIFGRISAHDY
jgi:hypothetical protein